MLAPLPTFLATVVSIVPLTHLSISPLSEMPNGRHYYSETSASEFLDAPYVLFQKWGRIVVGIDSSSRSGTACFKGFIEDNAIVDATRVSPPYTPDAAWDYQSGEMLNLSHYYRVTDPISDAEQAALEVCLEVFAR
ncbi:hypothetical protein PN498_13450 [Oscillatoria sp. CS-180]|uniref:hypothetical protein n=1 Tax=Oscillatoria sp. CS-180 TaxID=3021720 RepID=UPI00232CBADF|nr:hypothetical protein [Oscillatoria sp. CS-180]MDB9527000.1 hypothetical protein [Oscillatoria sp. CS-180]